MVAVQPANATTEPIWLLAQRWSDLLFAHWPVDADALARHLPAGVEPDLHEGRAWVAIVAFRMDGTRPAVGPRRLTLRPIPELNVRTYVRVRGVPGVWFLSLDASSPFFVTAGRALYGLPYRLARMATLVEGERVHFLSSRRGASFAASYEPCGAGGQAEPRSLEHFLVERYRLFSWWRGRLITAVVAHQRWPLQPVSVQIDVNGMAPAGLSFSGRPIVHFSASVDARISVPQPLSALQSSAWRDYATPLPPKRSRRTEPLRA
ncbi:MAG TPA: DUF2071 domain-containing protein [Gaiellaceae bacterium]|nr:DUF2071 domain-containing protein [Gaiellaceae bacterium]